MSDRKPLIAGNWKMYKTCDEASETARLLISEVKNITDRDIMIAPPMTALSQVFEIIKDSQIDLGGQNLYWEKEGAFTGEVSADMLISTGCKYVIIGHSERRQYFGETDLSVNKKIMSAISAGLIPMMCIGESDQEREQGKTFSVLDKQVKKGLKGFSFNEVSSLVLAYEPVWAIGTGKTATSEQAQEVHNYIREMLSSLYGDENAKTLRILYGGSVKPGNINEIMSMPDVDGALVGGASLKHDSFGAIINYGS